MTSVPDQLEILLADLKRHEWRECRAQNLDQVEALLTRIAAVADERAMRPLIRFMGHMYACGRSSQLREKILGILRRIGGEEIGTLVFQVLESDDTTADAAVEKIARHLGTSAEEAFAAGLGQWDPRGTIPRRSMRALAAMGLDPASPRGQAFAQQDLHVKGTAMSSTQLMHLLPFSDCSVNPSGGYDLKQATSIRHVPANGQVSESCGVQLAATSGDLLDLEEIWVQTKALHQNETVFAELQHLTNSNSVRTTFPHVVIWSFDLHLSFTAKRSGLYQICLLCGYSPDYLVPCEGASFVYFALAGPQTVPGTNNSNVLDFSTGTISRAGRVLYKDVEVAYRADGGTLSLPGEIQVGGPYLLLLPGGRRATIEITSTSGSLAYFRGRIPG